ncbi:MAG: hypothetical protein RIQ48_698 [Pseudomonadota bacterium]|jgi:hypothetical protein
MDKIIIYLLLSLSLSFIWSFADIFLPIRNLIAKIPYIRRPILCPECCSFWIGFVISFLYNPLFNDLGYLSFIFLGLINHLIACFIYKIYFKLH